MIGAIVVMGETVATTPGADEVVRASVLESVLTVGGFVLLILLILALQVRTFRRRRRGEEATSYDGRGAEVLLGNWLT